MPPAPLAPPPDRSLPAAAWCKGAPAIFSVIPTNTRRLPCRERSGWEQQDTERDATIDRLKTEVAQLREGNRVLVESSSKQTQLLERAQQQCQDEQQRVGELRRLAGEERERSNQALKARRRRRGWDAAMRGGVSRAGMQACVSARHLLQQALQNR